MSVIIAIARGIYKPIPTMRVKNAAAAKTDAANQFFYLIRARQANDSPMNKPSV